jgi:predicted DNA-binding protein with PD1-like motif
VRSTEVAVGRRFFVVLEPGDDIVAAIAEACELHGVRQAVVPVFLGAFSSVTLIGTRDTVADPDIPMPEKTTVEWSEGIGTATILPDETGVPVVHLHIAIGDKTDAALGYSGHVLAAVTHYTVELLLEELTDAELVRRPDDASHGLTTVRF